MERSNLITSINKISVRFLFSALIFARVLIPDPSAAFTAIKVASMQSPNSVEFKSLQAFVDDVETLTSGLLEFRIVTIEENASPAEILEAVNDGEIDAVFLRINSLATKYPETMLFGSPVLGLGLGFDTSSFFSWLHYGGGSELYERMWDEIGLNIKSFILHSSGPNAMGWFAEPFENLEKLQEMKIRATINEFNNFYREIGVEAIPLRGPDIIPEFAKKRINGVSWCCPKEDLDMGLHRVAKYYYLQDVGTVVLNASININANIYEALSTEQKKAIEIASLAAVTKNTSRDIFENGQALKELIEYHEIILKEVPQDVLDAYTTSAKNLLEKNARKSAFFSEVWQSQKDFAVIAVPYWYQKQEMRSKVGKMFLKSIE